MAENIKYGESWPASDSPGTAHEDSDIKSSSASLVLLIALIMGMVFYIGSFYLDRKPLPEITKKQKQSESYFDLLPISSFEKNYG